MTSPIGGHRYGPVRTAAASHHAGKLSELTQLFMSCWEEIVRHQPQLVHPENEASLRRTIASRIISGCECGIDDMEELRRRALREIGLRSP
jgi:hypothetical protein